MIIRKQIKRIDQRINGYKFDFQFEMSYQRRKYIESLISSTEAKIEQLKERQAHVSKDL